MIKRNKTL
jgi:hypothetical protein